MTREERAAAQEARVAEASAALRAVVDKHAKRILLDLVLPNGKALRDCTDTDLASMGEWFVRLAEQARA